MAKNKFQNYRGSDLGDDFKTLFKSEKKYITEKLKALGCTNIVMSMQFYYYFGFFTAPNGKMIYFNKTDVIHSNVDNILVRYVKSYDDFMGSYNIYVPYSEIKNINNYIKIVD